MMKLTVQKVFDATQVLAAIINEKRPLPTKGVYRLFRMHAKMFPEFTTINDQRTAKVLSYGHKQFVGPHGAVITAEEAELNKGAAGLTAQDAVPEDKMEEFMAWWADFASAEIEVAVEPIPIEQLCIDGQESSISFAEFAVLGDLVEG